MTARSTNLQINQDSNHSPLIYVIESDSTQAELLKNALVDNGYRVEVFSEMNINSDAELPSAVVTGIVFSDNELATSSINIIDVCKNSKIPVIVTSEHENLTARLTALRAGAKHYLNKPVDTTRLISLLDELTNYHNKFEPYRVLLIDDDKISIELYKHILSEAGFVVETLLEPLKTLDAIRDFKPDLILVDVYMPEINGPELVAVLRDSGFLLPILFLSNETNLTQQLPALENGGDDFIVKPVQPENLIATVSSHAKKSRRSNDIYYRLGNTLYEREHEHLALDHHSIVSVADKLGNISYVNELFCEASGYSREELLGQNHRIIKSGHHTTKFYEEMWDTLSQGNVWHGENCNKRKDGSLFWVETTITPFLDSNGEPYQYVAIRTNISQIKENEQTLRAIIDSSSVVTGDAFFKNFAESLAKAMDVRFSFIAEKDAEDASTIKTIAIWDTDRIIDNFSYPIKDTPCENVLSTGLSVYSEMVAETFPKDLWLKDNDIESYIGIPLYDSNADFLGHMGVIDDKPMSNTANKIDLLKIFAASVATEMEREKSETALQMSESRLNFLVSSSPVTIYTCEATPPYAASYISPNINQLMGYEPEQFTNDSGFWAENIHPEDQQQVFDNLPRLFEHGIHQHEYRFKKQDGSYCWMHDELRLIKDENNHPVEIVGSLADISDRKLTEQALETNKERLRRGQVFANIGTWDWDIKTGELFWSERIAPLFGYPDGELETSYENFISAIHPDDRQMVSDAVTACVEQDIAYDIEHRVLWPDGTIHWLQERGAVTRDADGQPLHMLGVVQDIHHRKEAELALLEREQQLQEAQSLARIGNWKADLVTGDLSWSDEIYRIFGYDPGSFEPSVEVFHSAVHPDDRAKVDESEKRAEQTGHHDVIHRIVRPDGHIRHVHELARATKDKTGHLIQLTGTVQDITEHIEAEAVLAEKEEKFRGLYEQSPVGIALNEMDGSFIEANQSFLDIIGYTDKECHALSYWQLTPEEYAEQETIQLESLNTSGHYGPYEKEYIHKNGQRIAVLLNGSIIHDRDGNKRIWSIVQNITQRKQAEQAMQESEERFAFAVEGAGDGIWDWDMRSNAMQFSRLYMKMLGYAENELPQHADTWIKSVHPDDIARIQKKLQEYLEGQTTAYNVELRLRCKDDSYKWILCRGQVVDRDEDNNPIRMIGIHSDITEQKLAHVELNRFKTTLDMTKDCVFMFEPASLKFFYVNQGAVEQFGYSEAELMNMTSVDIKPDFNETQFRQLISPLIKGETDSLTFDTIHQHKNGLLIPVEISLQYIKPEGESARFVAIVRNIADRKIMQEQMEQQTKLLDMLHRSTTDFVEKGNFHDIMNDMLNTLLDLTDSEYGFIGEVFYDDGAPYLKTHSITNIAWNTETQILYEKFKRKGFEFRNLNTLFGHVLTSRKSVVCNDPATDPRSAGLPEGHPAMHCFLGVPIFYGKELVGMYGIANRKNGYDKKIRDFLRTFDTTYGVMIHSQRMTEMEMSNRKELVHAKELAERANKAKSEFLSSMSHELRTPMNAILGFAQLIEFEENMPKVQQDNVQEILTAGHHLLNLINEVLDLAKVESGHIELSLEPVDVHQVVEECFNLVETLAKKHNIRISHSVLKGLAVRADHTRFKQVLINLLSNAIKYNHEGGSVRLEALHDDYDKDRLKILVIDTGIGIPEASLADLFQPFNRLDAENTNVEGTGIGLTITRRIVEMMGGMIYVQSEIGVGSTFSIELPLESLVEHDDVETAGDDMTSSQIQSKTQHTILYIEDNPANLKLVAKIMGRRKHVHLLTAHTPEIGIKLARERLPELILLDINMPNMSGYEVMEIFKADASLKNIPVVAVTANAMSRDLERGKAAGFSDYITKPINVVNFLSIMDNYLPDEDST